MKPFHPVCLTWLCLLAQACADSPGEGRSRAAGKGANLLLVSTDTVRADRLGAYGYEAARTPVIDALAQRGTLFEQAYTPAPMTLPAHSTLMTGLLPPQHGARVNGLHRLEEDVPTLAERLAESGYRTAAFVAAFVLDERFGLGQGFELYDDDLAGAYEQEVPNGLASYRSGDQVVDAALGWLDTIREADPDAPFFAWVHLYDAHYPWYPHATGEGGEPQAADASKTPTGTYDGEVAFVDEQVGRLHAWLERNGLVESTIVAVVADHGEGLGDHSEIEHAYLLNEEVLHVPWILAGPGVRAGQRVAALVSLEDFQPTVLELLGAPGTGAHGRSLVAALAGGTIPSGESYAETDLPWTSFRWAPQRSLTTVDWKYVRTPETELYDRASDREEYANLAHVRPEVVAELEGRLGALEAQVGQRSSAAASLSSDELEQLAALGYTAGDTAEVPTGDELAGAVDIKVRLPVKDLNAELRRGLARKSLTPERHVEIAQRLVAQSPETPSFHAELGDAFTSLGDYTSALPSFERAVELAPTDAGVHYSLGDALQQAGRTADARPHIEMALELEPKMATAHVAMGNILRSEGRVDLAAGSYSEALRLRPEYPEAHYNLALTFSDRGLAEKALRHFEQALAQRPGWDLAHRSIARLLLESGSHAQALPHLGACLETLDDADLRNDLGLTLHRLGRPQEALEQFLAAMRLAPGDPRPHFNRANMALEHGNEEIALAEYQATLQRVPDHVPALLGLARLRASASREELRDGPRAIALAQRSVELTGGSSAGALEVLALALASDGHLEAASSAVRRAQERARAAGDEELAAALEASLAGYERGTLDGPAADGAPAREEVPESTPASAATGAAPDPPGQTPAEVEHDPSSL